MLTAMLGGIPEASGVGYQLVRFQLRPYKDITPVLPSIDNRDLSQSNKALGFQLFLMVPYPVIIICCGEMIKMDCFFSQNFTLEVDTQTHKQKNENSYCIREQRKKFDSVLNR